MEVFSPTGLARGAIEGSRVALKPLEYRYHDDLAVAGAGAPSGDGCRRVELKADVEDLLKSRAAIERPDATEEGVLREHMLYADGCNRGNIYFSIVDDDWPAVVPSHWKS